MKTNNQNDFSKRTENNINSILKSNDIEDKSQNQGDGNLFSVNDNSMVTRIKIKKAGFILLRSNGNDKVCYFKCF